MPPRTLPEFRTQDAIDEPGYDAQSTYDRSGAVARKLGIPALVSLSSVAPGAGHPRSDQRRYDTRRDRHLLHQLADLDVGQKTDTANWRCAGADSDVA